VEYCDLSPPTLTGVLTVLHDNVIASRYAHGETADEALARARCRSYANRLPPSQNAGSASLTVSQARSDL
jgi:hypothetical protein